MILHQELFRFLCNMRNEAKILCQVSSTFGCYSWRWRRTPCQQLLRRHWEQLHIHVQLILEFKFEKKNELNLPIRYPFETGCTLPIRDTSTSSGGWKFANVFSRGTLPIRIGMLRQRPASNFNGIWKIKITKIVGVLGCNLKKKIGHCTACSEV